MINFWFIIAIVISLFVGAGIGFSIRNTKYDGIITLEEQDDGKMLYSLIVSEDPELLANHKEARFKIISRN